MKAGTTKTSNTTNWKIGNIFAKNNTTSNKKEEPNKTSTTEIKPNPHWTEKVKGLNANDKAKVLENELKTLEQELKEKNETIKCIQELRSGVGMKSSAADFHKIKDKECRQLVEEIQKLYREIDDFNQTVNFDDKSKYEPPVAPVAKLMTSSNGKTGGDKIVPRHYQRINSNSSNGPGSSNDGNSKLANIRWNWEEHNLKIVDLNNRLKAAYDYIKEISGTTADPSAKSAKGPISATTVSKTEKAPGQVDKQEPALWYVPDGKGVDKNHKNMLLAMAGGAGSESDEDVYKAAPASSFYSPPEKIEKESSFTMMQAKVYAPTYENGNKPDWINELGEIHITPVQAVFIDSVRDKAEQKHTIPPMNPVEEPVTVPVAAKPRNAPVSNLSSQNTSSYKTGSNNSDLSDNEDKNKKSGGDYKPYNWSNYRPQTSSSYNTNNNTQSQMKSSTTTSSTSKQDTQAKIQPRAPPVGNVRQSSNAYNSDCD